MPRIATRLTQAQINRLKPRHDDRPTFFPVGGVAGLYWQITPHAGRSWVLRVTYGGRRRWIGLGSYPAVKLDAAYRAARETKDKIAAGVDPIAEKRAAKAALAAQITFRDAVDLFEPVKKAELSDGKYRDQWRDSLDKYAVHALGDLPVQSIALKDVLSVLSPLWETKTVTADKLRRKVNEVLDYATVMGHREGPNPARWEGNLALVLAAPSKAAKSRNYPSLQLKDAARWSADLADRDGVSAAALRWQALTATRAGAVRGMTWDEVDFENRIWTVQPGRQWSKIGSSDTPRRVPLTETMIELLRSQPKRDGVPYVFPAIRGGALSDAALGAVMDKIHKARLKVDGSGYVDVRTGEAAVPHGLRSSFRVWAREHTGFEPDLAEAALWHKIGNKVQQAYDRSDMLEKRRALMAEWGEFLGGIAR